MKEVSHDDHWFDDHEQDVAESGGMDNYDPFSTELAPGVSLIVHMRIYDVLLALLREQNSEVAEQLTQLHAQGKILGPLPVFDETEDS